MAQDALNPQKLVSLITSSADTITSPLEAIAAFSHACMLATGFRFLGFGEDHKADTEFDESNVQQLWTTESSSHREFRYAHPQSSLEFIVKVSRMGGKTVIMGVAVEDDKTTSFDVKTEDFTSPSFFPWTKDDGKDVINGFIAENRLKDLAGLFKINILQKLIPGLNKSGYTEEQRSTSTTTSRRQPPRHQEAPPPLFGEPPNIDTNPLRNPLRPPYDPEPMPDFEDPYDLNRPLNFYPEPNNNPLSIGHDDLNPPGLGNPFTPVGGLGPTGLPRRPGQSGQGGMLMDIRGRGRAGQRPPGVPPGARWDPIGPGRGRGGGGNPFGGYMDEDFI